MIRQFRLEDAAPGCKLIYDCLDADPSLSPSLRKKLRNSLSPQSMREHAKLFYLAVYELESKIVGIAGLDLNEIRILYVSPESRRTGIGRALFNHLADMAPAGFFAEIFVYSSLMAVEFYKELGFSEKGPVSFDVEGELMHTIFMACPAKSSTP